MALNIMKYSPFVLGVGAKAQGVCPMSPRVTVTDLRFPSPPYSWPPPPPAQLPRGRPREGQGQRSLLQTAGGPWEAPGSSPLASDSSVGGVAKEGSWLLVIRLPRV